MIKCRLIGRAPINVIHHKEATDKNLEYLGYLMRFDYFYIPDQSKAYDMLDILYPDTCSLYTWTLEKTLLIAK